LATDLVRYASAAVTDLGCKRSSNEDAFGLSAEDGVYVVCDGMGGAAAGEIASSLGVGEVLRLLCGRPPDAPLGPVVEEAIRAANEAIYSRAQSNPQLNGMGTTLVGLVTEGRRVLVFNVGDSRCYRLRHPRPDLSSPDLSSPDLSSPKQASPEQTGPEQSKPEEGRLEEGRLEQISLDHSLVEEQVRMGRMTHAEALRSTFRNVITRALGTQSSVTPDLFEVEAEPGEIFLLCSDGLTGEVSDAQIESMLTADLPLDELCANLVDAANQAGGHDNITCLLVRAES
jgi:protein phosphatase